jgi:ubiquinone/menaquinone biosynthesis C-methylase UbiE
MLNFHNFIKKHYYDTYLQAGQSIFEIAGGRGGDLRKIVMRKPAKIALLNINRASLNEAKRRFENYKKNRALGLSPNMNIELIEENMTRNGVNLKNKLKTVSFDIIAIQFAIHYFMQTEATFDRVLNIIKRYLKKGGYFFFTCFDGAKVADKLKNRDKLVLETYNKSHDKTVKVFELQKKYAAANEDAHFGRQIMVFVETLSSANEEGKLEYLVDTKYIREKLEKNGFRFIESRGFEEYYGDWVDFKRGNVMSDVEKEFSFLNSGFVFQKIE